MRVSGFKGYPIFCFSNRFVRKKKTSCFRLWPTPVSSQVSCNSAKWPVFIVLSRDGKKGFPVCLLLFFFMRINDAYDDLLFFFRKRS